MLHINKYSLKFQITVLLIILTVTMVLAVIGIFSYLKKQQVDLIKHAEQKKVEKTVHIFDLYLDNYLQSVKKTAQLSAVLYDTTSDHQVLTEYIHISMLNMNSVQSYFAVFEPLQGEVLHKIKGYKRQGQSIVSLDSTYEIAKDLNSTYSYPIKTQSTYWYTLSQKTQAPVFGLPYTTSNYSDGILTATCPIKLSNKKIVGAVGLNISSDTLRNFLEKHLHEENIKLNLIAADGQVIISSTDTIPASSPLISKIISANPELSTQLNIDILHKDKRLYEIVNPYTGKSAWLIIFPVDSSGWYWVAFIPIKERFWALNSQLYIAILLLLACFIIVEIVSALFILSNLINPILIVADAANRVAQGELMTRVSANPKNEEITVLLHNFNNMTSQIHLQNELLESKISDHMEIERKLLIAQSDLETNMQKFEKIFLTIPDGAFIASVSEGRILDANNYLCNIFGYQRYEVIGRTAQDLGIYKNAEERQSMLDKYYLQGDLRNMEMNFRKRDGTNIWISISISYFESNNLEYTLGIVRDITEEKKQREELEHAKNKAEQSDDLKNAFLQNMSHEIRTPLNAIVGFAELMGHTSLTPENKVKFTKIITNNSRKLIGIITDVIEISQLQSGMLKLAKADFKIGKMLREIQIEYYQYALEKNLNFEFIHDLEDDVTVISDSSKIERIITHTIDNAIKFTSRGTVIVAVQLIEKNLEITVSDTGIGISEEMQKIIFDPFRQVESGLRRNYGGNGLGLTIIKSYIDLLDGSIVLKSKLNTGSTFKYTIPVGDQSNVKSENLTISIKTVLIAEDEMANQILTKELLMEKGLEVLIATNGKEAIDICKQRTDIELVLMDIKMPVMDGLTATRLIKEFRPNLPIIALTAFALEIDKEVFRKEFDDYIINPNYSQN